jgi:hypothetical protein
MAATAAGVALLACSHPAEAAPVCKSISVQLLTTDTYAFKPAQGPYAPFNIAQTTYASYTTFSRRLSWDRAFFTPNSEGARALVDAKGMVATIPKGDPIGPQDKFGEGNEYGLMFTYGVGTWERRFGGGTVRKHVGNIIFGQDNYIGFQFLSQGAIHYGWARIKVTFYREYNKPSITHIEESGYETEPSTAIAAGACSNAVPEDSMSASDSKSGEVFVDASARVTAAPRPDHGSLGALALGTRGNRSAPRESK